MRLPSCRPVFVFLSSVAVLLLVSIGPRWTVFAQAPQLSPGVPFATIAEPDLREWLTYLSSDALQGRQSFTEGYGLAAAYVADELRKMGVAPAGDFGYFQTVKRIGYRVTQQSTVSATVNGETRTFAHGEHVTFPVNGGARQSVTFNGVEVVGYGMVALGAGHDDFSGRQVGGRLVVWMPGTPAAVAQAGGRGGRGGRSPFIVETYRPGAVLTFAPAPAPPSPDVLSAESAVAQATQA
ncbi:MAG TPA: hypothetical protein VMM93_00280, partial [Vicinamibacterales bacterium]|nr:hypothetical protein [Vicinamibacterales bacterium]